MAEISKPQNKWFIEITGVITFNLLISKSSSSAVKDMRNNFIFAPTCLVKALLEQNYSSCFNFHLQRHYMGIICVLQDVIGFFIPA